MTVPGREPVRVAGAVPATVMAAVVAAPASGQLRGDQLAHATADLSARFGRDLPLIDELVTEHSPLQFLTDWFDPPGATSPPRTSSPGGTVEVVERLVRWQRRKGLAPTAVIDEPTIRALAGASGAAHRFGEVCQLVADHYRLPHRETVVFAQDVSGLLSEAGVGSGPVTHGKATLLSDRTTIMVLVDSRLVPARDDASFAMLAHVLAHELAHADDLLKGRPTGAARHFEIYLAGVFPGGGLPPLQGHQLLDTAMGAFTTYQRIPAPERTPTLVSRYHQLLLTLFPLAVRAATDALPLGLDFWNADRRAQAADYAHKAWAELPDALRTPALTALHDTLLAR